MGILFYRRSLEQQTGLTKVVFSQPNKTSQALEDDILRVCCTPPVRISIDSDNFLRFFRIEDQVLKIMHAINHEVERFKKIIRKFFEVNPMFRQAQVDLDKVERQSIDMLFEFNAWMTEQITHAQKRVSKINNFTFTGEGMLNEAGHIANLTNQLKIVLLDVRMTCLQYTKQGIDQMRKCPHCGLSGWMRGGNHLRQLGEPGGRPRCQQWYHGHVHFLVGRRQGITKDHAVWRKKGAQI